jgi:hypothetical protein
VCPLTGCTLCVSFCIAHLQRQSPFGSMPGAMRHQPTELLAVDVHCVLRKDLAALAVGKPPILFTAAPQDSCSAA